LREIPAEFRCMERDEDCREGKDGKETISMGDLLVRYHERGQHGAFWKDFVYCRLLVYWKERV